MSYKKGFSVKQEQALILISAGLNTDQVAAQIEAKPATIRTWLKDDKFKKELKSSMERQRDMFEGRIVALANRACLKLHAMIENENPFIQIAGVKLAVGGAVRLVSRYKELQVEGNVTHSQPMIVLPAGTRLLGAPSPQAIIDVESIREDVEPTDTGTD